MPHHAFHDLLADRHGRVKTRHRVLEYHGNASAVDMGTDPFLILLEDINGIRFSCLEMFIGKHDLAAVDNRVLGENAHGGFHRNRFAGTGLTYDRNGLAPVQTDVHTADGVNRSGRGLECDIQILDIQNDIAVILRFGLFTDHCSLGFFCRRCLFYLLLFVRHCSPPLRITFP